MNSWDLCILLKSKGVLVSHFPNVHRWSSCRVLS